MQKMFSVHLMAAGLFFSLFVSVPLAAQETDTLAVVHVRDNIWTLVNNSACNVGVFVAADGFILVDDRFSADSVKITTALSHIAALPVKYIINTHWHADHSEANEFFVKAGSLIVSQENSRQRLTSDQFIDLFRMHHAPRPWEGLPSVTFTEDITFHEREETIRVFHVPTAHTDGDAVIHFQKSNTFHTGDLVIWWGLPFIDEQHGGNLGGIVAAVERVIAMCDNQTKIIPGHGSIGTKQDLIAYVQMLKTVRDRVADAISRNLSLEQTLQEKPADGYSTFFAVDDFVRIVYRGLQKEQARNSPSAETDTPPLTAALDEYFQKLMDTSGIPGLAVAVVQGDNIRYLKGFGVKSLETRAPLLPEAIFHVASLSKPFAATAIMQLVDQGKINLDERLVAYLPYFKMADDRYRDITIRQILNHTSGMPDVQDYQWEKPQLDEGAAERYARSLAEEKMLSAPGKEFHYSNMAYDVLADVVAKVSGQPFDAFAKQHILLPLEMVESSFYQPETNPALRTAPHTGLPPGVSDVYPYNRRHAPSSTLNSSAREMANWLIADLNGGIFKGKSLLNPGSHAMMMTPSFLLDKEKGYAVGLSWFIGPFKEGTSIVIHSGGDPGYASFLTLVPDKKLGFVLLSNYDGTPMEQINFQVLDILLEVAGEK